MPNLSTSSADRAASFVRLLVDVLRREGGYTWDLLVRSTRGRTAFVEFDGYQLRVAGREASSYEVEVTADHSSHPLNFSTDAATVRDIIQGRLTLDKAIAGGRIFVRGSLDDLLHVYQIAMNVLADAPRSARLREVFHEFDRTWPVDDLEGPFPIESQSARHGHLVSTIPEHVLLIQVDD